ncbi:hypothetical protein [Pseudomarimonas salicorniae]|uniref:Uncharacterized protein n=1 Tax=Pseudomarimonas salicorniae TaxID=2933270 RepID=A0ABT0GE83_9GAMM|nr:hypothetical protein [Lysobacter sp. CAU 1642]MCK7592865.1 hypothetical protein [Lysobacter sp. CAU 1642]
MTQLLLVFASALGFGVALASIGGRLPVPGGLLGLAAMLLVALAVRRRWGLLEEAAPGTPERQLWVSLAGHAVVCGHLLTTLWRIGPELALHTPAAHAMGIDSWTLVAGAVLAYLIARDPEPRSDERDSHFAQLGMQAGYYTLVALLIAMILALGFVRGGWIGQLSHAAIAHGLILVLMLSVVADALVRLRCYALDATAERAER